MMEFLLIARRDLTAYITGWYGPIIIAILVFLCGVAYNFSALGAGAQLSTKVLEQFFFLAGIATGFAAWLMSMRAIAEEKQTRTELVLLTSPIADWKIVLGKYLAVMGMVLLFTLCTVHMPLMIQVHGKVSLAQILVGYSGMILYGSSVAAVGVFASALVRSQLLAAVISGGFVVFFVLLWTGTAVIGGTMGEIAANAAIWDKHFQPFQKGDLAFVHVFYYISFTWVFLLLATQALGRRRWQ